MMAAPKSSRAGAAAGGRDHRSRGAGAGQRALHITHHQSPWRPGFGRGVIWPVAIVGTEDRNKDQEPALCRRRHARRGASPNLRREMHSALQKQTVHNRWDHVRWVPAQTCSTLSLASPSPSSLLVAWSSHTAVALLLACDMRAMRGNSIVSGSLYAKEPPALDQGLKLHAKPYRVSSC